MKRFAAVFLFCFVNLNGGALAVEDGKQANELVRFLTGKWDNVSFEIADGKPIKREQYPEMMLTKSEHVLTIRAHGYRNGKDLVKDMELELKGDNVKMAQGGFVATGKREGNVYSLKGNHKDNEFRFRLYTMGDKYVFHREIWKGGVVVQVDQSYLVRTFK